MAGLQELRAPTRAWGPAGSAPLGRPPRPAQAEAACQDLPGTSTDWPRGWGGGWPLPSQPPEGTLQTSCVCPARMVAAVLTSPGALSRELGVGDISLEFPGSSPETQGDNLVLLSPAEQQRAGGTSRTEQQELGSAGRLLATCSGPACCAGPAAINSSRSFSRGDVLGDLVTWETAGAGRAPLPSWGSGGSGEEAQRHTSLTCSDAGSVGHGSQRGPGPCGSHRSP